MARKRHTPEQVISKTRALEVDLAQGQAVVEVVGRRIPKSGAQGSAQLQLQRSNCDTVIRMAAVNRLPPSPAQRAYGNTPLPRRSAGSGSRGVKPP